MMSPEDWHQQAIREAHALAHKHNMRDLRRIILALVIAIAAVVLILR